VREKVGADFTIMIKINSSDFKDCKYICQRLDELGIDACNRDQWGCWSLK